MMPIYYDSLLVFNSVVGNLIFFHFDFIRNLIYRVMLVPALRVPLVTAVETFAK